MDLMKKKDSKEPPPDQHLKKKMTIRLGEPGEMVLKKIAKAEERTYTTVLLRALRMYAKEGGYDVPANWTDPPSKGP